MDWNKERDTLDPEELRGFAFHGFKVSVFDEIGLETIWYFNEYETGSHKYETKKLGQ